MNKLYEAIPSLSDYHIAFMMLAIISLITLIQNFLTAPLSFIKEEQEPGMPLRFDHTKLSFRALRTYHNSAETLPALGFSLLAAVIFGANPFWVNILTGVYLFFRLSFWFVYYSGIGKVAGGPRTWAFVGGLLSNIALVVMAIYAAF
ncbi:MAG: MAPEG family protein [Paraglaciecola sp.]|uniref:MAPEG family protein n=1 Tax=Paraglaciecola sp. TaxID=1920173 RepID=UPI003267AAAB